MELYTVLELDPNNRFNITTSDIKRQYKLLAKQYHPDKYNAPDAKEKFIEIHMAYETLIDEEKKRTYDSTLEFDQNDDWWDVLCKKYEWTKVFFSSPDDFQHDLNNLNKLRWNELKLSENIVRKLGEKIPVQITWKKDIILQVKINKNEFFGEVHIKRTIKYVRHLHKLNGIVLSFNLNLCEIDLELNRVSNYDEELISFDGKGNECIEDGRIVVGDLHFDIEII
jgi:DnaJ-class molecular chaperone